MKISQVTLATVTALALGYAGAASAANKQYLNNQGNITIEATCLNDIAHSLKLAICLTENQIINWQKDGSIEDRPESRHQKRG